MNIQINLTGTDITSDTFPLMLERLHTLQAEFAQVSVRVPKRNNIDEKAMACDYYRTKTSGGVFKAGGEEKEQVLKGYMPVVIARLEKMGIDTSDKPSVESLASETPSTEKQDDGVDFF